MLGSLDAGRAAVHRSQRPKVVVFQWWTGAVLHSYLSLARLARRHGARVVMEWHEVQDTGEARIPGVVRYVRKAMSALLSQVDAHVVHSQFDLELLHTAYGIQDDDRTGARRITVVPHGPYDHVNGGAVLAADGTAGELTRRPVQRALLRHDTAL